MAKANIEANKKRQADIAMRIERMAQAFDADPEKVVSIKVRPGFDLADHFDQAYWGGHEYNELWRQLDRMGVRDANHLQRGRDWFVEEHETGPEIFLHLSFSDWVALGSLAVTLIQLLLQIVDRRQPQRRFPNDATEYEETLSIEVREIIGGRLKETIITKTKKGDTNFPQSKDAQKILKKLRGKAEG